MRKSNLFKIFGAKGKINNIEQFIKKITNFAQQNNIVIQAFNAEVIFGKKHLISAFDHAIRAMERITNTTNSLEMEILLYASGERQLKLAIPKMGVKKGDSKIAFILIYCNLQKPSKIIKNLIDFMSLQRDDKILVGNKKTLKKFGIKENEIKTVTKAKYEDLILEKVAMVDILK